ncbi:MYLK3 kinase, partial [Neopipo cinnamomea]|nr:MYLK3 kinase [Neopipo cinnamomea]
VDKNLYLLNEKMDKLLHFQEDLTGKLQQVNRGIDDVEKGINKLAESRAAPADTDAMQKGLKVSDSAHQADVQSICSEVLKLMKAAQLDASKHKERLAKIEKRVDTLDKVITFVGEVLKNSKVVDFILKGIVPWKKGSLLEIPVEAKDKPEESGAKPKHVLSNRGTQTESKKPLEACEKVNTSGAVAHKADSKPQVKERTSQEQVVEGAGKTHSNKSSQQQKDIGVKGLNQHNGLPLIHEDHVGNQNVPTKAQNMDRAPCPDECHRQLVHQKLGKNENKPPPSSAASREAVPSTSQAISDTGCEVTHTSQCWLRMMCQGVNLEMGSSFCTSWWFWTGACLSPKDFVLRRREANSPCRSVKRTLCSPAWRNAQESCWVQACLDSRGRVCSELDQKGTSSKVKPPSSTPADLKGVKQLPDKLKLQQSPKNISTEPNPEVKGDNKQNELTPQTGKQQPLLSKPKPGGSANDVHQCPGVTPEKSKALDGDRALPMQGEVIIDDSPSPPAPFEHRIVSVKQTEVTTCYSVCRHEVLGGGRFGQVHKCTEISTGLNLAAKIIKVKGAKEKEEVKNEINIMNQLNHVNLIQLYDAFEAKNSVTLIMEYLDGGELFDRITDENYHLTELDAILFTKQICEGVHYLHQHYILHLDLKPENILCVNHTGNQIKIIDFGLARRYKPCEKLKVNFGTPEFLAPEVVNYDFVSFPTDMWSVGVITYMLLSGLSPFLGETDAETMNYVLNCSWDFDAEAFEQLSEEAKDFISRLLVKEKSCRMSATQCLKHEWLNNLPAKAKKSKLRLKSQLLLQSYMAQRKWKKHFYVVAAANRLKRFQSMSVKLA